MRKSSTALVAAAATAMLALLASGCGASTSPTAAAPPRVAFIPQLIGIPYFTAMEHGGQAAAKRFHVDFNYDGPTTASAASQLSIYDSLIAQHYNAISISVLDPNTIDGAIARARKEGIVALTTDSDSPNSVRQAFVSEASNKALGYTLADQLAKELHGQGQVGIVSGSPTATNLNAWIGYIKQRLTSTYPHMSIVDTLYAGGSSSTSLQDAQNIMAAYPHVRALIAVASSNIPGVCQAVEDAHKVGSVTVTGYGSPMTVKPYMQAGVMKVSILWNPYNLGYLDVWAMRQFVLHRPLKPINHVPGLSHPITWNPQTKVLLLGKPLVITPNNVGQFDF